MAWEYCRHCKARTVEECQEPVDERFPQEARDAYARAGLTTAVKCARGQAVDMARTGWCLDRAVRHPEWDGDTPIGVTPPPPVTGRRRKRAGYPERAR